MVPDTRDWGILASGYHRSPVFCLLFTGGGGSAPGKRHPANSDGAGDIVFNVTAWGGTRVST
jgi:hypothetical protein